MKFEDLQVTLLDILKKNVYMIYIDKYLIYFVFTIIDRPKIYNYFDLMF